MVRALRRRREAARPPACSKWTGHKVTGLSEIPCRVIQSELPGSEVISNSNRLITGKPSSYAALSRTSWQRKGDPVGSRLRAGTISWSLTP